MNYRGELQKGSGLVIALIIAAIVVLGTGGYITVQNLAKTDKVIAKPPVQTGQQPGQGGAQAQNPNQATVDASMRNLLALDKDVTCTFSKTDAYYGSTSGVVYVSGNALRGDFTTTSSAGAKTDTHLIKTADKNYMWSSQLVSQGTVTDRMDANPASAQSQAVIGMDEKVNYVCQPWKPEAARFAPPQFVTFKAQ